MNIGPNRYRDRYRRIQRPHRLKAEAAKTLAQSKGASRRKQVR